jgi:hypothetical protein
MGRNAGMKGNGQTTKVAIVDVCLQSIGCDVSHCQPLPTCGQCACIEGTLDAKLCMVVAYPIRKICNTEVLGSLLSLLKVLPSS